MSKKQRTYSILSSLKLIKAENEESKEVKEKTYNHALIALRKKNLLLTKEDKNFASKILHFNKVVKSKEVDEIADIIKFLIRKQ